MKKVRENLLEAKLNLPQEYINKVKQDARERYGNGPSHQDMMQMGRLLQQIFPLQRGHEDELTELGKSIIQKFYGPIIEGVELDVKIVDPNDEEKREMAQKMVQQPQQQQQQRPTQSPKTPEREFPGIEDDITKRKIINNIMQGEAQNVHSMIADARNEIEEITGSRELVTLYLQFLDLNKKFDWDDSQNLEMLMQQAPEMANAMETSWDGGDDDEGEGGEEGEEGSAKPTIKARVLDLPMIIHETVKGIYELIAAGAIDPDPERANKVLAATDSLKDEQEDIRFGPYIAKDIRDYVNKVAEKIKGADNIPNIREFVFGKMVEMPSKEFVELVTAMLMNEPEPEKTITDFINDVMKDFQKYNEDIKNYNMSKYTNEPEEETEEDDLLKMIRGGAKSQEPQPQRDPEPLQKPEEKKPKYVDMGINALNVELNKAIDKEDWETAQEIQKMIERKGGIKESLNELMLLDMDEEKLKSEVEERLVTFYKMPKWEAKYWLKSDAFKNIMFSANDAAKKGAEISIEDLADAVFDEYDAEREAQAQARMPQGFPSDLEGEGKYDEEFPDEDPNF